VRGKLKNKVEPLLPKIHRVLQKTARINIDPWLNLTGFIGLLWLYYNYEKTTLLGPDLSFGDTLKVAFPQAAIDYLLLKSGTEVGVGAAIGHVAIRSLAELAEMGLKGLRAETERIRKEGIEPFIPPMPEGPVTRLGWSS
jgi:hypothetical protein